MARDLQDQHFDEVYQLAADMGGAGFVFTGTHDAEIMQQLGADQPVAHGRCHASRAGVKKLFYSSSACIYPALNQQDPEEPNCEESSAYPADPDSEYGWEKLFSERLFHAFGRNCGLDVCIARFHNIFGPEGTWRGGREKAPAALCRKIAEQDDFGEIEIWGDGRQTRSFLYIDECLEGMRRLMRSSTFRGPVNIGSDEMVTIDEMAHILMRIAGKRLTLRHVPGPTGVRGRNSDNRLIKRMLGWAPSAPLAEGLEKTYRWIESQVSQAGSKPATAAVMPQTPAGIGPEGLSMGFD